MFLFHPAQEVEKGSLEPLNFWIGVLAHEMLHAIIGTYCCLCWKKCYEKRLSADFGIGKITCGIKNSVCTEMLVSGWVPTETQLKNWDISTGIDRVLQIHKQTARLHSALLDVERVRMNDWLRQNDKEKHGGALQSKARLFASYGKPFYATGTTPPKAPEA